jgi:hypothetical protein
MRFKHMFQGIGLTVGGAFLWLFWYLLGMYQGRDQLLVVIICALFGLLISAVYTVPLGVVLGLFLPSFCARHGPGLCCLFGAGIGSALAGTTSMLVAIVFDLSFRSVFRTMLPFCTLLIAGWALFLRRQRAPI